MLRQLRQLDPADFEQLIGELLRALGINDVAVTAYHGDKGIERDRDLRAGAGTDGVDRGSSQAPGAKTWDARWSRASAGA